MKKHNACVNSIDQWDKRIVLRYNKNNNEVIIYFLKFISFFGRETIWILLIYYFLFLWYDPIFLSYIGITFVNGIWLNVSIKSIINRKRPFEALCDINIFEHKPTSRSFPSWHAYNGMAQAIILIFLLDSTIHSIVFSLLAISIGLSRIFLGVHYPSDVIAGFILGIVGAAMTIMFFGPLILVVLHHFEQVVIFEIQYKRINPLLGNSWYFLSCVLILSIILILTFHKYLKKD